MAGSTYAGMKEVFGVGEEVCILSISLFVAGLGCGPRTSLFLHMPIAHDILISVFLGPCSEFVGRSRVLHYSFISFFRKPSSPCTPVALMTVLNFPVAFGMPKWSDEETRN